jgi:hypothetical protein
VIARRRERIESDVLRGSGPGADGERLLRLGVLLFLLGLLTGFAVPALTNPRMALTRYCSSRSRSPW